VVEVGSAQRDGVGAGPGPGTADGSAPGGGEVVAVVDDVVVVGDVADVVGEPPVVVPVVEPLVVVPLGVVDSVGLVVSVVVGLAAVVVVLRGSCTFGSTFVRGTQV
jgi:hypothetical protein